MTRRLDLAMLLLLTFSTGMVDAIGYLGFDKVFTGNMTGNVVILGMGLVAPTASPSSAPPLPWSSSWSARHCRAGSSAISARPGITGRP